MPIGRWSVFRGMLNNYDESKETSFSHPALSKCPPPPPTPPSLPMWWWVVGVGRIMSFAKQTRVKMNGCPFGSKMAIIIPTWCRQIKPQSLFDSHSFLFSLIFLLFLCPPG